MAEKLRIPGLDACMGTSGRWYLQGTPEYNRLMDQPIHPTPAPDSIPLVVRGTPISQPRQPLTPREREECEARIRQYRLYMQNIMQCATRDTQSGKNDPAIAKMRRHILYYLHQLCEPYLEKLNNDCPIPISKESKAA